MNLDEAWVLTVDDDPDTLEMLRVILRLCNARVMAAASADEALRMLDAVIPSAIISDLAMPGHDGYWLINELRRRPPDRGGRVPALAVTGHVYDRERVLSAGFEAFMKKPVDPQALCDAVAELLSRTGR
jgi:CheY-like chemotaxis protein